MSHCQACRHLSFSGVCLAVVVVFASSLGTATAADAVKDAGRVSLESIGGAKYQFDGLLGQRAKAYIENWLLVTPQKNPGMLQMFVDREKNREGGDGNNKYEVVPWAGEFVGKYLTSAALAMRMSDDPRLRETVSKVVDRLIQLQAEDGYLGVWPKKEQLMGHWDLWGHYHAILGLTLWYEQTGDPKALAAACKAADLVCKTFLDTDQRVYQAHSEEMNMGIIHGLAILYHKTGEARYLRMAKEVLKDFERGGDYYNQGVKAEEYYRTPKPRWESLHSLQGMAELYLVTGDETFRRAFLSHWASMRRFDLRNTGGFSSGEQATGNPFVADQAIETCCVIAWAAVMLDALRLTGDSTIADDLELATFNAVAGAEHPSGEWCTYNTPINGSRGPSHVQIAFQARPDAMFLNCCSVNGPRGFGMMSQWGVMRRDEGLAVSYYGPMRAEVALADKTAVVLEEKTDYPIGDTVRLKVAPAMAKQFTLALRIPAWSPNTKVAVNGQAVAGVRPGEYLSLNRSWKAGDEVTLQFDLGLRYESGDLEQAGHVSLYRGPILLCTDDRFPTAQTVRVDVSKLKEARLTPIDAAIAEAAGPYRPWIVVDVPAADGKQLRLIDFASAGATGKGYVSWLPAADIRPPRPVAWLPLDGAKVGPGAIGFAWRASAPQIASETQHMIVISDTPSFATIVLRLDAKSGAGVTLPPEEAKKLHEGKTYYWKVVARNRFGEVESLGPHKQFTIDPNAPSSTILFPRNDGVYAAVPLHGDVKPEHGQLIDARGWKPAAGPSGQANQAVETDGKNGLLKYGLLEFPSRDYTVALWVAVKEAPTTALGQIFSAWCRGMDDPLRLAVADGKIFARIEAGQAFGTEGVPMEFGKWHHIAAIKQGDKLSLYVDGQVRSSATVPVAILSGARDFALGGNPHHTGPEYLAAQMADFRLYGRAISAEELKQLVEGNRPK